MVPKEGAMAQYDLLNHVVQLINVCQVVDKNRNNNLEQSDDLRDTCSSV